MHRELVETGRQHHQLLGCAGRSGDGAEVVAEHPRHQRELFLAADRARHRTGLAVVLRGAQQVGIGVADLRDAGASRVHLGQQGPPLERVVHHLSLQSHDDQSTSALSARRGGPLPPGSRPPRVRHLVCGDGGSNSYDHFVATRQTAGTRAKDTDRNNTCQVLDSALADGQLSMEEHRTRVATATTAATLGDLQALVDDLQTENAPVQMPDLKKPSPFADRATAAREAAGGCAPRSQGCWWSSASRSAGGSTATPPSPLSFTSDPGAKPDGVAPVVLTAPRQLQSLGGLTGLFEQMKQQFGDTMGYKLADLPRLRRRSTAPIPTTTAASSATTTAAAGVTATTRLPSATATGWSTWEVRRQGDRRRAAWRAGDPRHQTVATSRTPT